MNDEQLEQQITEAMAMPTVVIADQIETAYSYAHELAGVDPVLIAAGATEQGWARILEIRELLARWFAIVYPTRMAAEAARAYLRGNGGGDDGDPA